MDGYQDRELGRFLRVRRRLIFEGAVYHITQRAPGQEQIFVDEQDYKKFLGLLKKISEKHALNIFAFSLLSNHLHLLLQISSKNLSVAMKCLFESYAKYYNRKYQRKGHVFCGVYRSSTCFDDAYLLTASIYIHLNAVRAGCCAAVHDYRWHSVRLYVDPEAPFSFVKTDKILGLLSDNSIAAKTMYLRAIEKSLLLKPGHSTEHPVLDKIIRRSIGVVKHIFNKNGEREAGAYLDTQEAFSKKERRYLAAQLLANGSSPEEIQKKLEISRATYFRLMAKH